MRLGALLEDDSYRVLARQTCNTFSVEMMQHPFLFVNLLDAIVGLELGVKNITGVLAADTNESSLLSGETQGQKQDVATLVRERVRAEAGIAAATSTATMGMLDIRQTQPSSSSSHWLQSRNPLFRDLKPGTPPKNFLLVCETGSCRMVDI